ncbi:GNAT family N-acetyltransferase [Nonomuraea sp. NPDC050556]|uniref:GNAT family N-acetyltransferase n=1 Tax=Nonomuraea sp. NPDC050556 TaxID=3364369 RepID=UPI00379D7C05
MTVIRRATPEDAARLLELQLALDKESTFMLLEPGERQGAVEVVEPSFLLLAVDEGGPAAGYVHVDVMPYARARRTGYVVMGVRAASAGKGLGKALLARAAEEAQTAGLVRLELTVMCHNRKALNLYLSSGYQVEGLRRSALDVDGRRVDEYYMGVTY